MGRYALKGKFMITPQGLKTLFDLHKSNCNSSPNKVEMENAKKEGFCFDPENLTHEQITQELIFHRNKVDKTNVVNAFIYSLGNRQLEFRSALGSYAVALNFPSHDFKASQTFTATYPCNICGLHENERIIYNSMNYERYKYGGVRHLYPEFVAFDLREFQNLDKVEPNKSDLIILKNILCFASQLPAGSRLSDLDRGIGKMFKSNKNERHILLQILSYCGILQPIDCPGFLNGFPEHDKRGDRLGPRSDWPYPASFWKGHGIVNEAVKYWFPIMEGA